LVLAALAPGGFAQGPGDIPPPASRFPVAEEASLPSEEPEAERANPFEDHIETDRDSFTPATTTVGKGRLVVESSYSFIDNRHVPETHSFPELLVRYGLTDRIELRLGSNYEIGGKPNSVAAAAGVDEAEAGGLSHDANVSYGLKVRLTEQDGWVPESSAIVLGSTPTSGEGTATEFDAGYVFGWELPNRWKLDAALRYAGESEMGDRFEVWAPSVVLRAPVGERVNVHVEYFGLFSQDRKDDFVRQFVSPGVHYLITPNVEVGFRLGWGLTDQSARFFSNVGVGMRF
jgi:hypothetical protein